MTVIFLVVSTQIPNEGFSGEKTIALRRQVLQRLGSWIPDCTGIWANISAYLTAILARTRGSNDVESPARQLEGCSDLDTTVQTERVGGLMDLALQTGDHTRSWHNIFVGSNRIVV